jgi:hypothetical protein
MGHPQVSTWPKNAPRFLQPVADYLRESISWRLTLKWITSVSPINAADIIGSLEGE